MPGPNLYSLVGTLLVLVIYHAISLAGIVLADCTDLRHSAMVLFL